jgi:TATA-binding protein-associated factor
MPGFLGSASEFNKRVVRPVQRSMMERTKLIAASTSTKSIDFEETSSAVKKSAHLTAEGMSILKQLHSQVLPFILRRLKNEVATDLPPKTIIDIYCSLSPVQEQLQNEFFSDKKLTENQFCDQLLRIRAGVPLISESDLHPFQSLTYLKLLAVHPALVIQKEHKSYRNRLLKDAGSSGKLLSLVRLLVDAGVILENEYNRPLYKANVLKEVESDESDFVDEKDSNDFKKRRIGTVQQRSLRSKILNDACGDDLPQKPMEFIPSSSVRHKCLIFGAHIEVLNLIEEASYFANIQLYSYS